MRNIIHIQKHFSSFFPSRNTKFSKLSDSNLSFFQSILAPSQIITEKSDLQKYNIDWMNKYKGSSLLTLLPKSSQEISKILSYCNKEKLAIVPQSGNTGLVGGGVPLYDEIILSMLVKVFSKIIPAILKSPFVTP